MNQKHALVLAGILLVLSAGFVVSFNLSPKALPAQHSQDQQTTSYENVSGTKIEATQIVQKGSEEIPANDRQKARVVRVVDGDTVEIEGGQKIRYIGIDTPESTKTLDCFGREATAKNRDLVDGKIIRIEKDVSQTDKYGRLLRYVWIDQMLVNDYLVRQGYAYASSYPPDIKYQDQLTEAQKEARENNRGLWAGCQTGSSQPQDSNCQIKGNISSSGEKIYHLPGQKYYEKTIIDESRGERWFCTQEEAIDALWRKSKI